MHLLRLAPPTSLPRRDPQLTEVLEELQITPHRSGANRSVTDSNSNKVGEKGGGQKEENWKMVYEPQLNTTELKEPRELLLLEKSELCKAEALKNNHSLQKLACGSHPRMSHHNLMKTLPCFRQLNLGVFSRAVSIQIL